MSTEDVFRRLLDLGVELRNNGDGMLMVEAPTEVLTDKLRQMIREHKPALLEMVTPDASPPDAAAPQSRPAAEAPLPQPAESELTPPASPRSREGQACEPCSQCSGSWYYLASDGWVCGMCLARKAAARATTSVSGLLELLVDFVDALAVADPEGTTTGRDWIEVFAPYQHARGMRPAPPREVWSALEELGYEVRGEDTSEPLIIGLRLMLGKKAEV